MTTKTTPQDLGVDARRHPRTNVDVSAELVLGMWPRRRTVPVTVENMSSSGIRIRTTLFDEDLSHKRTTLRWRVPVKSESAGFKQYVEMNGTLLPKAEPGCYGFRFDQLLEEEVALRNARPQRLMAAAAAVLLAALIVKLKMGNMISFWYDPFWQTYSMLAAAYVVSRIVFSMRYEQPEDHGVIKALSVVLPIKNEEQNIEAVVRRLFCARYPADMFEVIAVDDGSTDGTWAVLERIAPEFPKLQIHRFERNKGKRHAMALGAEKATGEILIYMDSDSMIDPEGFYRIIQPFHDERVGAVAGHTDIIIEENNVISKMEAVRYFVSQRVMKAAESVFGAVTCCPGPFSAYRRDAVLKIIPAWLNQMFMGAAATFGDDRSLTTRILENYSVVYHAGARCSTYAPGNWLTFLKQQLRWKKSWVRETTIAARRMWREHPMAALPYYVGILVTMISPLVVLRVFLYSPIVLGTIACLPYLAGLMLVFLLLGVLYYYHTQSRYWYYGLVFAVVYSWVFSLQTYYAMITVKENHWGTR
jgi:hyaluronan synthase